GRGIAEALKGSHFFTGTAISMIAVGEESGHLVEMLESCCEFYQDKFNERTEFFMTLIEPLLIIFVGGIVGVVILAIYLPMFDIINVVN
ncbi:MAG: type II secretion system F family protein, partial [Fusobacteriaceae bacterium]